jgi:hypothetical protein
MSDLEINGIPVWEAETEIDEFDNRDTAKLRLVYKGEYITFWNYKDIKQALDFGVDKFVKDVILYETVKESHVEELERFFTEWILLIESNTNENWT